MPWVECVLRQRGNLLVESYASMCCDNGNGTFLDERGLIAVSAPASYRSYGPERTASTFGISSSIPTKGVAEPTTEAVTTPTPTESRPAGTDDSGSGTNTLAISLGVAIPVVVILAAVGAFFYTRRRRRSAASYEVPGQSVPHEMPGNAPDGDTMQEAPKVQANHPLHGAYAPVELAADADSSPYDRPGDKYR
ncbi:hypothetical protein K4F52_006097 [Lecanicillium sp. MT-2017a]|nr:hypothetical protein K4F52_006097 [Lecanicillium sp. MT-2017a]